MGMAVEDGDDDGNGNADAGDRRGGDHGASFEEPLDGPGKADEAAYWCQMFWTWGQTELLFHKILPPWFYELELAAYA